MNTRLLKILAISSLLVSIQLQATVRRAPTNETSALEGPLNLERIEKVTRRAEKIRDPVKVRSIIPMKMNATSNQKVVAERIALHSFQNWVEKMEDQETALGHMARTAERLDKTVSTDIEFGQDSKEKINHEVKFNVRAAKRLANLRYSGYVKARLNYRVDAKKIKCVVSKNLNSQTKLIFNYTAKGKRRSEKLALRFNW